MDDQVGLPWLAHALSRLLNRGDEWLDKRVPEFVADISGGKAALVHVSVSARGVLLAAAALLLAFVVPPIVEWLLRRLRCMTANFRAEQIPNCFGIAVILCCGPLFLLDILSFPESAGTGRLWLAVILGFGALGLLDDLRGDKKTKGLRGHLQALFLRGRVTTGLVKAFGGLAIAGWAGHFASPESVWETCLAAAVIALAANSVNLLDLRPGRACGFFVMTAVIILLPAVRSGELTAAPYLIFVLIAVLAVWPHDAAGQVMLGDTGSNALGASLGLAICSFFSTGPQVGALIIFLALHVVAERISITALIDQVPMLRTLDRLTGVRSAAAVAEAADDNG